MPCAGRFCLLYTTSGKSITVAFQILGYSGSPFDSEDNEVVGKVYDAECRLKYATGPRDAHLAGSVRATLSRLLRELVA